MSTPRQYLLCDNETHADVVDQFIADRLRDIDGSRCSAWSGVYTDGERFGVVWGSPASELFGAPGEDQSVVIAEDSGDWARYVPPAPEPEEPL
jgi:hypothetical protein